MARTHLSTIDSKAVRTLVEAHAVHGATVLGQPGGWAVLVHYGSNERAIAAQRSRQMRLWRNLNTAASYIREELHLPRFAVDAEGHAPETIERKRPDTAERQRRSHQAVEHDRWFRSEVQKALNDIDHGADDLSTDDDHQARWEAKRAELSRRIERPE